MRLKQSGVLYDAGRPTPQGFGRRLDLHSEAEALAEASRCEARGGGGGGGGGENEVEADDAEPDEVGCSKCRWRGCGKCRRGCTQPRTRQHSAKKQIGKRVQTTATVADSHNGRRARCSRAADEQLHELPDPSMHSLAIRRADAAAKMPIFAVGQRVQARYQASQASKQSPGWYRGVVQFVHEQDGVRSYKVRYDDGDKEDNVLPKYIKALTC